MNYAIILSGGVGTRIKIGDNPKQYLRVNNKPILVYTLEKFEKNENTNRIVIVAAKEWQNDISEWIQEYGIYKFWGFALPGDTRQGSILSGLSTCMAGNPSDNDVVIMHDAARPLVSNNLISECIVTAEKYDGCMPVLPINDTTYQSEDGKTISGLLDRGTLFAGQAPEAFKLRSYANIINMISKDELDSFHGTSEIAYRYGMNVKLIPGDDGNFKLTTPKDLERFRMLCSEML